MNKKIIKQIGIFLIFTLLHTPIFAEGMIENETAIELDFSGQGIYSDPFKKGVQLINFLKQLFFNCIHFFMNVRAYHAKLKIN